MYEIHTNRATIDCIRTPILKSNCYIINLSENTYLIIDPGDPDITMIKKKISDPDKANLKVILTHEHGDHCAGLNLLYEFKKFELFCTSQTGIRIKNSKLNLSKYFAEITPFEINIPVNIVQDRETVVFQGSNFTFVETPGHSPGSSCIIYDDGIFTGDTLMYKKAPPLNLPGSDREEYEKSIKKLYDYLYDGVRIFPGHGEVFYWKDKDKA